MRKKQLAVFLAIVLIGAIGLSFVPVSGVSVTSTGNRLSISTDVVLASKPAVDTESTGTPAVSKLPSTESSPVSYSPDTETLRPNAAGDECNIPGQVGAACPNHWQNVNETPSDEATSYVWNTVQTAYSRDFYNITNSTGSGTISNITVYARVYGQSLVNQASLKIVIKSGTGSGAPDTISESAEKTVTTLWANYSEVWATNNATSSAWTWDEVDNLQIGVSIRRCWFEQPAATRVTQVYVNVDYGNATAPAINNTPASYDFGTVETSTTLATGLTVFNVTNTGDVPVNISISGTNMTGGTQWTLNDTATPGADIYGLKAGVSGTGNQSFFPIDPIEVTPGTANDWIDVNSTTFGVPSGATGVLVHLVRTGGEAAMGLRKKGSTDNRITNICVPSHSWAAVGVDANGIFQVYVGDITYTDVYIVGYTTTGVTFFDNAYDKTPSTLDAWTNIDCHVEAPNAIGLIWEMVGASTWYNFGLRKNGSTDNRITPISYHCSFGAIIGCDTSQICQGYTQGIGKNHFFLVGYITDGATFNTNATDISLSETGNWTDLTALPSNSVMGFIEITSTSSQYNYGLRKNGSAENIYRPANAHPWAFVEGDTNGIIEGKIANTGNDFFVVGYATGGGTGGEYDTTVKLNSPYNNLCTNLSVNATQSWGLKLYTPTSFSDGYEKTGTVTLTATEA